MKLNAPFPLNTITQHFGENANPLYAGEGLKGHTADDFGQPWGTPVPACITGPVYSVINRNNPDPMKYRAVFQLIQDETGQWYEISYGHLNDIYVQPGQTVNAGEIIGTVGNTGEVYSGNHFVTGEEKLAGSHAGAHLHGPQVRVVERVKQLNGISLYDGYGVYRDSEGYYFQVVNYNNGYNGCVAPDQFFGAPDSQNIQKLADAATDPKQKSILQWLVSFLKAGND